MRVRSRCLEKKRRRSGLINALFLKAENAVVVLQLHGTFCLMFFADHSSCWPMGETGSENLLASVGVLLLQVMIVS
jgi:hypothetical protein